MFRMGRREQRTEKENYLRRAPEEELADTEDDGEFRGENMCFLLEGAYKHVFRGPP